MDAMNNPHEPPRGFARLPSGEVKAVSDLTPDELSAYLGRLKKTMDRGWVNVGRVEIGLPPLCGYWDSSTESFCTAEAVVVRISAEPVAEEDVEHGLPGGLCAAHAVLAEPL